MRTRAEDTPRNDEIRAALDRIIVSDPFRRSPQLVAFLRYIVETTLRAESDDLKEYTVAVVALGRGEDFNPKTDPLVRIEAGRLRRALEKYYSGPGKSDSVVIEVPLGHYVPTFRYRWNDVLSRLLRTIRRAPSPLALMAKRAQFFRSQKGRAGVCSRSE